MSKHSASQQEEVPDFNVVRTEAAMLHWRGQYERAIKRYGKALELATEEKRCLVARSQCFLHVGDNVKALAHAETSLKDDKTFYKGILRKAEAMFFNGDFEMALVFYHRGRRLRPDVQEFSLGIQKASEAIENSVGTPERVKLNTTGDLSFFESMAPKKNAKLMDKGVAEAIRQVASQQAKRVINTSKAHKRTVRQMLGELYKDQQYLEALLQATDESTETGKTICSLADECLRYLDRRTDFWRQQKPMYSRLYDAEVFQKVYARKDPPQDSQILTDLEKIDEAHSAGKYWTALTRASKCLQRVDIHSDSQVTNKMALKAQLHSCMGNAYLQLQQYERALKHHKEDFRIGKKYGIVEAICRSLDNIGRVHLSQGEYPRAISVWESKLALAKGSVEGIWLCHEIGRCYMELGKASQAMFYANQSMEEAEAENLPLWQLHNSVLIAQCQVKMKDLPTALTHFQRALSLATDLNDEAGREALEKSVQQLEIKIQAQEEMRAAKKTHSKAKKKHSAEHGSVKSTSKQHVSLHLPDGHASQRT